MNSQIFKAEDLACVDLLALERGRRGSSTNSFLGSYVPQVKSTIKASENAGKAE